MAFREAALGLAVLLLVACGGGQDDMGDMDMGGQDMSANTERQEFAFTGTVVSVDTATGTARVENDDVPGWMMSMTMGYYVEPVDVLRTLNPGDEIAAKVYAGDTQHLYEVRVAP